MLTVVKATLLKYNEIVFIEVKNGEQLKYDDIIVAETRHGKFLHKVLQENINVTEENIVEPDGRFIRLATDEDFENDALNDREAEAALEFCRDAVKDEKLGMHLITSKYSLDKEKLIFFYTADERVDFRSLVRILAQEFKTRIELRQVGLREKARYLGGVGPCGYSHCCSTYLGSFEPVSIQMAKNQDLSLTPVKISGACGRLMCCLSYENDHYESARKRLPDVGEFIYTPKGKVEVIGLNILELQIRTKNKDNYIYEFSLDELEANEV
ncbi:regulatory iron-sulfur-containing complex subunit RicT [Nosocomiicoccus sp. HMSC09A07]|uniref:PSP1 domain-containing protein n=1 Tax=Nosocomiicoccus sp. HMSC09A07 TaxID=1581145 RepID=UPI0008A3016C|nr:regulatory iron-sulfur-containing complex subunit RicT [Nosocomiicoccus sp. HMSC09A07]